ncbi:MAG: hypothetical protein XD95_0120 [Microgenomates bacterium 39_7]|nr:MAG: hypothetical protein XD95_0120 [Microgenomates bacterium 39_7]
MGAGMKESHCSAVKQAWFAKPNQASLSNTGSDSRKAGSPATKRLNMIMNELCEEALPAGRQARCEAPQATSTLNSNNLSLFEKASKKRAILTIQRDKTCDIASTTQSGVASKEQGETSALIVQRTEQRFPKP